jgi:hypothetical protein
VEKLSLRPDVLNTDTNVTTVGKVSITNKTLTSQQIRHLRLVIGYRLLKGCLVALRIDEISFSSQSTDMDSCGSYTMQQQARSVTSQHTYIAFDADIRSGVQQ